MLRAARRLAGIVLILALASVPAGAGTSMVGGVFRGSALPVVFPMLVPGSATPGSWPATAIPPVQGDSTALGGGDTAIAGWSVPPFIEVNQAIAGQTADQATLAQPTQKICLDAFHINGLGFQTLGIQRASFSLNGGPWADVPIPLYTAEAGAPEYCAFVNVATFAMDTPWEVRAIVYPVNGQPIVLQGGSVDGSVANSNNTSLWGYAAAQSGVGPIYYIGSSGVSDSNDCKTAATACASVGRAITRQSYAGDLGGTTICIKDNSTAGAPYDLGTNISNGYAEAYRYLTFRTCGGTSTKAGTWFSFGPSSGFGHQYKIHLKDMTLSGAVPILSRTSGRIPTLWLDNVDGVAKGIPGTVATQIGGDHVSSTGATQAPYDNGGAGASTYLTGGTYSGYDDGLESLVLNRGTTVQTFIGDVFSHSTQVVNSTAINNRVRETSGPYTVIEVIDGTHLRIAKTMALYDLDCLDSAAFTYSCNSQTGYNAGTQPGTFVAGPPDQSDTTSNNGQGSTVIALSRPWASAPTSFVQNQPVHPDIYQTSSGEVRSNIILYNTTAVDTIAGQGLGIFTMTGMAVVDANWANIGNALNITGANSGNILIANSAIGNGARRFSGTGMSDIVLRNVTCPSPNGGNQFITFAPLFDNAPTCQ